jgi:hypothetical protein
MLTQVPLINLNGSDAMELARQYHEAAIALQNAVNLMGGIVHGRDYPLGGYQTAQDEMVERIKPVIDAYNDLTQLARACAEQA